MIFKFPKILSFHNVRKYVEKYCVNSTYDYIGFVKLHGTNCSIVRKDGDIICQSRRRIITSDDDNHGFCSWVHSLDDEVIHRFLDVYSPFRGSDIVVFGEWIGNGIQSGVAVSNMEKSFVVFAANTLNDSGWLPIWKKKIDSVRFEDYNIYNITRAPSIFKTIDFNHPEGFIEDIQTKLDAISKQCPFAATLGYEGPGEGYVFYPVVDGRPHPDTSLFFKIKTEAHKVTRTKKSIPVDTEVVETISEFVKNTVTDNRLNQGLQYMQEMGYDIIPQNIGRFIKWVVDDILQEEKDVIEENSILNDNLKMLRKNITTEARNFYLEQEV